MRCISLYELSKNNSNLGTTVLAPEKATQETRIAKRKQGQNLNTDYKTRKIGNGGVSELN